MTNEIDRIVAEVSSWDGIEAKAHRFGGTEFRLGPREVGHVHEWGILDIAFPRRVRDQLVDEGKTGAHHIYPESGWTTFRVGETGTLDDALWLLRLSYLSHAKIVQKSAKNAGKAAPTSLDVESELANLEPSEELRAVL
ncbi:luciferase family protein [Haladaptatus pallidirubidus]|uniref:Luciferase domain-containing protein n=1 Tax=Haladaptatus pallidirubidus TaxID=1008152 RepID=A0AAV3UB51_9EURY|nr:luciferase family protein [Haladaptatus pallidirubidus]